MSFYLVSVETGAIKIVLIIKQQDSNNANVEVCSVLLCTLRVSGLQLLCILL